MHEQQKKTHTCAFKTNAAAAAVLQKLIHMTDKEVKAAFDEARALLPRLYLASPPHRDLYFYRNLVRDYLKTVPSDAYDATHKELRTLLQEKVTGSERLPPGALLLVSTADTVLMPIIEPFRRFFHTREAREMLLDAIADERRRLLSLDRDGWRGEDKPSDRVFKGFVLKLLDTMARESFIISHVDGSVRAEVTYVQSQRFLLLLKRARDEDDTTSAKKRVSATRKRKPEEDDRDVF